MLDGQSDPALLLDTKGAVLATNPPGQRIVNALESGHPTDFKPQIVAAMQGNGPLTGSYTFDGDDEAALILEVQILPLAPPHFLLLGRDVTLERNLRAALVDSRERFKDLVEASSDFAWEVGPEGRFVYVSPRGALGFEAARLVGHAPSELLKKGGDSRNPFVTRAEVEEAEVWVRRADGTRACLIVTAVPLQAGDGAWRGARGVCRDVTSEREKDAALARAHQREKILNSVVGAIRDEVDPQDMLDVAALATAQAISADGVRIYRGDERDGFYLVAEQGTPSSNEALDELVRNVHADHRVLDNNAHGLSMLAAATPYRHQVNGAICVWRDEKGNAWSDDDRIIAGDVANRLGIALEQFSNHERILKLSRTDGLTGLLNRRAFFEDELPHRLRKSGKPGGGGALVYVDLDNFKLVNDVHGHQAGDDALLKVCEILDTHTRASDLLARLGGDEFVLWLDRMPPDVVRQRVDELHHSALDLKPLSGDMARPLGFSVGVAIYDPAVEEGMESLVARADAAMYTVKNRGKGGIEISLPGGGEGEAS
ncbi:diguanylate cyclase domain-containing protein [Magnetospira sp. QH-2]|uniref:sensor domain-containing diguanylate cyclase n=1 Tax=Magnetospira sp. (strain QH-2) TaxID=1288970 RepID=UPI0005FA886A|nr:diguanylate cyclase [Magnetospira sp. QH-2]